VAGRAGDAEIDAELARDATDPGRRRAMACRAAIGDAEHKAAAWRLMAETDELGVEDAALVARAFNAPEHAGLLRPYAEKYFQALPEIWTRRDGVMRLVLGQFLFPYTAASPRLLERVDEFLGRPHLDPVLARVVAEGRDTAEKALRSRAAGSATGAAQ
jgi:aminopeptidase N